MRVVRLLLVDDEARYVETLSKRLTARGFYVDSALSGRQALELLANRPFDVVLLDVRMPGMDGLDTLRAIRRIQPLVKVILLSGHASISASADSLAGPSRKLSRVRLSACGSASASCRG
jgi:DNA-binding response OmpR family regulator